MKRVISTILLIAAVIFPRNTVLAEDEQLQLIDKSDTYALYNVLDFDYEIPYESGTVSYKNSLIREEKNGAYLDYSILLQFDISDLSKDEQQWFADDALSEENGIHYFVTKESGEIVEAEYVNSDIMPDTDGKTPSFYIVYSLEKQKHSIDGLDSGFLISIQNGKQETSYNYLMTASVVESK